MLGCKPVFTLLIVGTSLTVKHGVASVNATTYRQMVGGLQHLRMTRTYISFPVNKLSQFMQALFKQH